MNSDFQKYAAAVRRANYRVNGPQSLSVMSSCRVVYTHGNSRGVTKRLWLVDYWVNDVIDLLSPVSFGASYGYNVRFDPGKKLYWYSFKHRLETRNVYRLLFQSWIFEWVGEDSCILQASTFTHRPSHFLSVWREHIPRNLPCSLLWLLFVEFTKSETIWCLVRTNLNDAADCRDHSWIFRRRDSTSNLFCIFAPASHSRFNSLKESKETT